MTGTTTWQVKTLQDKHAWSRTFHHKLATYKYLARRCLDDFRIDNGVVSQFQDKVKRDITVFISKNKVYKTIAEAKRIIHGKYMDQYKWILDYYEELMSSNPKSTFYYNTYYDNERGGEVFQKLYICL